LELVYVPVTGFMLFAYDFAFVGIMISDWM